MSPDTHEFPARYFALSVEYLESRGFRRETGLSFTAWRSGGGGAGATAG